MITVAPADPRDPGPRALLEASHALMQDLFAPEENHFLSIEELTAPDIRFFVAREDGACLGTGALALRGDYGEVKSMFTAPEARRRGVAALILDRLEQVARLEGLDMLRLETGTLLEEARKLYARHGFVPCGPFGAYRENATSIFMEKRLT
ncbi:GNAT family N-acetyltransferase [Histidinibacterium lentulum]|uniref:GNAT family N-acetyltransferase n=1 Tax=Histidinibacterium lentulum TaxID=2480588 RepID=A0A3N2R5U0_9RHOB|nr:GNAT family N-acetyltransferase [Histidinibacterium lentulum]ROU02741.1 GNAT family N-acetyltransferase [Histidinibacterium lentulum]